MTRNAGGQGEGHADPLSEEVLKGIVGGNRPDDAKPMDGERAAALTAGIETAGHATGFMDVSKGGFLPVTPAPNQPASQDTLYSAHEPNHPGPAQDAKPGDAAGPLLPTELPDGLAAKMDTGFQPVTEKDAVKAIEKSFRPSGNVTHEIGEEFHGTYARISVEKDLGESAPAKVTKETPTLDKAKDEAEATHKAGLKALDDHRTSLINKIAEQKQDESSRQTASQEHQQTLKSAQSEVNKAFDNLVKSEHAVLRDGSDGIHGSQKLVNTAQYIHDTNTATVKATADNLDHAVKSGKAEDIQKARTAYMDALSEHRASQAMLDAYKTTLKNEVAAKTDTEHKALSKAIKTLSEARSDSGEESRPRSASMPAAPAGNKSGTDSAAQGAAQPPASHEAPARSATTGDTPHGTDALDHVDKALKDGKARQAAEESAKQKTSQQEEKDKNSAYVSQKLKGFADKAVSQALTEAAKQDAKANGTYENTIETKVTHGGMTQMETTLDDGTTVKRTTIAQTTLKEGTESWDGKGGKGANTVWSPKAEAGYMEERSHKDADGKTVTEKDKAYASAEWQNKAGFSITPNAINAEASTRLIAHAELSHSETKELFGLENTTTTTLAAHAEAGAQAGFHLGFDGLKAEVSASAEATASVTAENSTKIGEGTATVSATAFAQAKAEASASAEVTFDPSAGKVKAKVGGSLEATAGIGADLTAGGFTKEGNGVTATGHFKAGSVGVKFEPDLTIENGKVDLKLSIGGYLGVGGTKLIRWWPAR